MDPTTPPPSDPWPGLFDRVLYVDDFRELADVATVMLHMFGFEARAAYDGPSALAEAEEFRPGACVVDLNMPGMAGDELAAHLRRQAGDRPLLLVALTARSDDPARRRIAAAGFHFHLVKPVDPDDLLGVLDGQRRRGNVLPPPLTGVGS